MASLGFFVGLTFKFSLAFIDIIPPQIAPLLFDTLVTSMTIIKAFSIRRCNGGPNSRLIQTFLREGKTRSTP